MSRLLNPKNDVVFQKLFGVKENERLLISFLNSVLGSRGEGKIKSLSFEEKRLDVSMIASEKLSILDIKVITEKNVHINVEIQLINQYNMIKRTVFYLSKMILKQLIKGENYSELNKTLTINILDFNYIESEKFHTSYHLYEDESKKLLSDIIEIHFIELSKFNNIENKDYNNKLHKWLSFLINPGGEEIDMVKKDDLEIKEALDVLYQISGNNDVVQLAELRDKAIRDEKSRLNGAKEEGRQEGRQEGRVAGKLESLVEVILENLVDIEGAISEDVSKKVKSQTDFAILKSWSRISARCSSIDEFMEKINEE